MTDNAFRWFVAIGVLLSVISFFVQAGLVFALYRMSKKAIARGNQLADRAEPILDTTARLLHDNASKVSEVADRAVEIARSARMRMEQVSERVTDAVEVTRRVVEQADHGIDRAVEKGTQAAEAVKTAVEWPAREAHGVWKGLRAGISTYRRASQEGRHNGGQSGPFGRAA